MQAAAGPLCCVAWKVLANRAELGALMVGFDAKVGSVQAGSQSSQLELLMSRCLTSMYLGR